MMRRSGRASLNLWIITVLLLLMAPILALQIYNYTWNAREVSTELQTSASQNVSYLQQSFQDQFDTIVYQQNSLLSDLETKRYAIYSKTLSDADRYVTQEHILSSMRAICYANRLVSKVELYYPELHTLFRIRSENKNESSVITLTEADTGEWNGMGIQILTILREAETMSFVYAERISSKPWCLCKVTLKQEAVLEQLGGYSAFNERLAFLVSSTDGVIFSTSDGTIEDNELLHQRIVEANSEKSQMFYIHRNGKEYTAFLEYMPEYSFSIVQLVDKALLNAIPDRLTLLLVMMAILMALAILLFSLLIHQNVNRPVKDMLQVLEKVGEGDLKVRSAESDIRELNMLSVGMNSMISHLDTLIEDNYQQTILLQQAKLHQFQSQIKPHFLYNSFFMLRHAADEDDMDKVVKICSYLGNYFRFIARLNRDQLPLREEIENTEGYISIQEMRFSNGLTVIRETVPEEAASLRVPALILQPLIENAIDYGMDQEHTTLRIAYELSESQLLIHVEDSGTSLTDEKINELNHMMESRELGAHAIVNIHNRLRLAYGEDGGLRFSRSDLGGCKATLQIPNRHVTG